MDPLVTTDWLAEHLDEVRPVDATLLDPSLGRDTRGEFAAGHIPGARYLDLASLRDTADPLPNMLPRPAAVADRLAVLGIAPDDAIVLYDASPWRSSARAWFVLRHAGVERVALLDGGLTAWRAESRPLEQGTPASTATPSAPSAARNDVRDLAAVRDALASGAAQVVDARSAARFVGDEADPHGAAPGHMPGALNLPYPQLFDADGRWKRGDALRAAFTAAGVDPDRAVIATCGSGVTAAVLLFGLHLLAREGALYDGSWSEWGADPATPKALGPA